MTQEDISATTREFIKRNFLYDEKKSLGEEESLMGSGVVDSTGILELIAFLEETFGLKFRDDELVADNFDSLAKISVFVAGKTAKGKS